MELVPTVDATPRERKVDYVERERDGTMERPLPFSGLHIRTSWSGMAGQTIAEPDKDSDSVPIESGKRIARLSRQPRSTRQYLNRRRNLWKLIIKQ